MTPQPHPRPSLRLQRPRSGRAATGHGGEDGIALIEVILAVAFFGMAALGLLRALTAMSQAANNAKMELRMTAVLESTLTQFARQPKIEESARPIVSEPDESGVWTETRIVEMNEKNGNLLQTDESEQGGRQQLQQMYQISVTAYWELGGQRGEETAETYRYGPLFQQTGAQQGGGQPAGGQPSGGQPPGGQPPGGQPGTGR